MTGFVRLIDSPVGRLLVVVDDADRLVRLEFLGDQSPDDELARLAPAGWHLSEDDSPGLLRVIAQLDAYFAGHRTTFDLELAPTGTDFQLRTWNALLSIPYGATITYRELAERIGNAAAVRAVGRANGANPIPIVVPCHRVIGSDGSLTGFGGGLDVKRRLLELEGALLPLGS